MALGTITTEQLRKECSRRGLVLTEPWSAEGWDIRAIAILQIAAECLQDGRYLRAHLLTWEASALAVDDDVLQFAAECHCFAERQYDQAQYEEEKQNKEVS